MRENKIRELLEQLQDEMERVGPLDEKGRSLMQHITTDINDLLENAGSEADEPFLERLQDSIDHFKVEYPNLTMALSEMMSILSNAGI